MSYIFITSNNFFYSAGSYCGTALHHAAKKGLEQTVHLLLSHGGTIVYIQHTIFLPCDSSTTVTSFAVFLQLIRL